MLFIRGGFCVLLLIICTGCSASLHATCLSGDWYKIGKRDGTDGKTASHLFDQHAKTCSTFSITPDKPAYLKGQQEGLAAYCSPNGIFNQGMQGAPYKSVCPKAIDPLLRTAYGWGQKATPIALQLFKVQDAIADARTQLDGSGQKWDERDRLADEVARLRSEENRIKAELKNVEQAASKDVTCVAKRLGKHGVDLSRIVK